MMKFRHSRENAVILHTVQVHTKVPVVTLSGLEVYSLQIYAL